ncbi:MAG: HAMP domain-containing histidine kinase [SAR324 cluster bacterium]|nr:HAMP domain-containing histidine kinase [SAR324 cluster bacterium]
MRHRIRHRISHSILLKLTLILLVAGVAINMAVSHTFSLNWDFWQDFSRLHLKNYAGYIQHELGSPPQLEHAEKLGEKLKLSIRFESNQDHWSTNPSMPTLAELPHAELQENVPQFRRSRYRFFVIYPVANGVFIFSPKSYRKTMIHTLIPLMMVLTLILIVCYFAIKRVLRPLPVLIEGTRQVGQGRLDYRLPIWSKDELGQLSQAFNDMTEKLQKMIQAKEHLLRDVSHELRSPISRVKVALEFVDNSEIRQSIAEDMRDMETMVQEILETERLNSGFGTLKLENINMTDLCQEMTDIYSTTPPGVTLIKPSEPCSCRGDAGKLKMVLRNLLENSLKYSAHQSRPVEMHLWCDSHMHVMIQDFGHGIPLQDLPLIFEPFYRVDKSRNKATGGYGLGLSLCKTIVEAHGGTISVQSEEGDGCRIEVTLSLAN